MFWSPAETTLSVVCALAGCATAAPSIAMDSNSIRAFIMHFSRVVESLITSTAWRPSISVRGGTRKQQQRVARDDDRDGRPLVDAMCSVRPDVRAVRAHPIAIA